MARSPRVRRMLALVAAVAIGVLFFATQIAPVLGRPVERAEVVAVENVHRGLYGNCGRGDSTRADVTWHSADPPAGRPGTFTSRNSCDVPAVGETHLVVRSGRGRHDRVYVDPVTTLTASELGLLAVLLVACLVVALLGRRVVRLAARRMRARLGRHTLGSPS